MSLKEDFKELYDVLSNLSLLAKLLYGVAALYGFMSVASLADNVFSFEGKFVWALKHYDTHILPYKEHVSKALRVSISQEYFNLFVLYLFIMATHVARFFASKVALRSGVERLERSSNTEGREAAMAARSMLSSSEFSQRWYREFASCALSVVVFVLTPSVTLILLVENGILNRSNYFALVLALIAPVQLYLAAAFFNRLPHPGYTKHEELEPPCLDYLYDALNSFSKYSNRELLFPLLDAQKKATKQIKEFSRVLFLRTQIASARYAATTLILMFAALTVVGLLSEILA